MTLLRPAPLICHPWFNADPVRRIEVGVRRSPNGSLQLAFGIQGDLAAVRVPSPRAPCQATELWRHTCLEAFVAVDAASGYHEFNFAPSGEWAAYSFRTYRDGAVLGDETLAPQIAVRTGCDRFELDACIPLARLSHRHAYAPLRLGLAAVVEARDGTLSYWAVCHPAGKPDFHHDDTRVLRLEPPSEE